MQVLRFYNDGLYIGILGHCKVRNQNDLGAPYDWHMGKLDKTNNKKINH